MSFDDFACTQQGRRFMNDMNRIAAALEQLADAAPKAIAATEHLANAIEERTKRLDVILTESIPARRKN